MKKIYPDAASRQRAYRERKRIKDNAKIPVLDTDTLLEPIVNYFKKMNRLDTITPEQIELLGTMVAIDIPNLIVSAGRGFSKTQCASTVALWFADEYSRYYKKPLRILLVSTQGEIFNYIDQMFLNYPSLSKRLRVEGRSLQVPTREFQFKDTLSRVIRVIPTAHAILSRRCDILILDECASIPTNIVKTALACLSGESINKVIFISTPHSTKSLFNDYVKNTPKDWILKQYSSELCPYAQKTLNRLRPILSDAEWEVQVRGKVPTIEIIPTLQSEDIEACTEENIGLSIAPETIMLAGIDLANGGRSLNILTIVERTRGYDKVILTKFLAGDIPINTILKEYSEVIKGYNIAVTPIRIQVDSKPIIDMDKKLKEYCGLPVRKIDASMRIKKTTEYQEYTPTYKDLMRGYLLTMVNGHKLKIARTEIELLYQLRNYRGGMVYGDDYVDSLMLAITNFPASSSSYGIVTFPSNFDKPGGHLGNRLYFEIPR